MVYSIYCIKENFFYTKYDENDSHVIGIIKEINKDGNLLQFYVDDLVINHYCTSQSELYQYNIGDKIKVDGIVGIPKEQDNFYLFNYKNYLYSKKIHFVVSSTKVERIKTKIQYKYILKRQIIKLINNHKISDYLNSFIMGDNSFIDEDIMNSYQQNGISHLFSISGMHVSLLTGLILKFLKKIKSSNWFKYMVVCSVLIVYMFIAGFTPSLVRASILFTFCMFNNDFKLHLKTDYILIYIFCIALLYNPFYLYNNGFLFSYIISFTLIKCKTLINKFSNYFIRLFIISFISFLVSIPLMINSYFSINCLTPLLNMIFVPFVSFIIFPLSLLAIVLPFLDKVLFYGISIMESLSLWIANFDCFCITLSHITLLTFIFYYAIIIFIINRMQLNEYKYIVAIFLIIFIHHNIRYFDRYPTISFINVGQGDSILLTFPHNKGNVLIDCSNTRTFVNEPWKQKRKDYNVGESVIIPYLKAHGINTIDFLINTHGDYDHIGSLDKIIDNIKVKKVIFNSGNNNKNEKNIMDILNYQKINYYNISRGKIKINKYEILFLNDVDKENENEDSLIIYCKINGISILLMGDAGFETEKYLLQEYNLQSMDILKIGHHGSKYSSSDEFIKRVNPKYSVISVGINNKFGHPDINVMKKLADSKTYLTSINGSIKFILKNPILVNSVR